MTTFSVTSPTDYIEQIGDRITSYFVGPHNQANETQAEDPAVAEAPSEYVSVPYDYGYAPSTSEAPAYISDGELMVWLQAKSEEMYGQVRDLMGVSTQRSKLIQDLNHLKSLVDKKAPRAEIAAAMDEIQGAYAGTEFAEGLEPLCGDDAQAAVGVVGGMGLGKAEREGLATDIQGVMDELGREDQLTLVQIQSLMADIRETSQLTSNMIASGNQASDAIVGNIRG